jgi:hypothetical protein
MWLTFILKYKKPLIWLAVILAAVLVYVLWKRKSDSQKAIGDLTVDKGSLTITQNQATIISENLLGAMNKYGTDEQTIIDNLKTLRKDDLILVMKTFGVKPYNGVALATRNYEKMFLSNDYNLIGWLKAELDGESLATVKAIFENSNIPF